MPQADEAHTVPPPALPPQANILPVNGLPPVPALNGYWRPTRYGWRWITLPPGVPPPPPELGYFYGFDGTAPYGYNYPAYGPNFGRPFVHPFTFRDYQEFREFQRLYERFRHGRR